MISLDPLCPRIHVLAMAVCNGALQAIVTPSDRSWSLWKVPTLDAYAGETPDEAAGRFLGLELDLPGATPRHIGMLPRRSEDGPARVCHLYAVLAVPEALQKSIHDPAAYRLVDLEYRRGGGKIEAWCGQVRARMEDGSIDAVEMALRRMRLLLNQTDVDLELLERRFPLRALQEVHEAILGRSLNKPAFRKRILKSGRLIPTGQTENGVRFRPAELYRPRGRRRNWTMEPLYRMERGS